MFVPVRTKDGQQLMPMHAARARKLVKRDEATPYTEVKSSTIARLKTFSTKSIPSPNYGALG